MQNQSNADQWWQEFHLAVSFHAASSVVIPIGPRLKGLRAGDIEDCQRVMQRRVLKAEDVPVRLRKEQQQPVHQPQEGGAARRQPAQHRGHGQGRVRHLQGDHGEGGPALEHNLGRLRIALHAEQIASLHAHTVMQGPSQAHTAHLTAASA